MKLKRISVIMAIVLTFTSLFAVMAFSSSAASDIVVEDYGLTIPAADQTNNFVAYGQKPGTDTWTKISNWGGLRSGFLNNATAQLNNEKGAYEGGTVFGYMNADVSYGDSDYFKGGMQLDGTFVFDLGGHTLKATNAAQDRIIGMPTASDRLYGDTSYKTTIIVQNGTIYTEPTAGNKNAVVDIWASTSTYTGAKEVEIVFNNVTFKSNTTGTYRVVRTRSGFGEGQSVDLDLTFNNCVFDCPNTKDLKIYDDGAATNKGGEEAVKSNVTINGGFVNTKNSSWVKVFNGQSESDTLTETKALTYSKYLADYDLMIPGQDLSTGGTYYAYGQKPGETSWGYVGKWGGLVTGALANAKTAIANGGTNINGSNVAEGKYSGGKVLIYLTKNNTWSSSGSFDAGMQVDGTLILNLGGKTLTLNSGDRLIGLSTNGSYLYGDTDYTSKIVIENGTINTTKTIADLYGSSSSIYTGNKNAEIVFNNVTFTSDAEADITIAKARAPFGEDQTASWNISFNNCNFNYPNATGFTLLADTAGANAGSVEAVKTNVTVNGCKFNVNNGDKFGIFNGKSEADSYALDVGTTLKIPATSAAPSQENAYNVNGVEFVFVKESVADGFATYVLKEKELVTFVPKTSITLSNALVYNVYVPTSTALKTITLDGVDYVDLSALDNVVTLSDGNEYYFFEIELPSPKAARDIVLSVTLTVGEKEFSGLWTMNVPKYAKKVLEQSTNDYEKALAKDVLAYIKAAYEYFVDENDDAEIARVVNLVNEILAIGGEYDGTPVSSGTTTSDNSGIVTGVTLNLNAKPTIRFYVTDTNVSFKIGDKVLNTKMGTEIVDGTEVTYVELDVYAYALLETISFGEGGSYHISSFVKGAGENEKALANAFVKYVESAAAYRNAVMGK